jgi:ribosomal protein S18 acetylase RimI-like enzyme
MIDYHLRPATHDDHDFLYRLHEAAMGDLIAQVWGWDDAWQERFFDEHFDPSGSRIVVVDDADVGVVAVEWRDDAAFIGNVEILPDYQGRGLGAAILRDVIAAAAARGLPVTLGVLKMNPARRLYERLGFTITGETETHCQMRAALPE